MKKLTSLILALFSLPLFAYAEKRTIIVSGMPQEKNYENALEKLSAAKEELQERDVVIIKRKSSRFGISLIGKDGDEKWNGKVDFNVKEINQIIDQMPMRQREMRKSR